MGRTRMEGNDPDLPAGWMYRKIRPRPVEVRLDGRWVPGWLTEVARDPNGEEWGYGVGERRPWNRWVVRRQIRLRQR